MIHSPYPSGTLFFNIGTLIEGRFAGYLSRQNIVQPYQFAPTAENPLRPRKVQPKSLSKEDVDSSTLLLSLIRALSGKPWRRMNCSEEQLWRVSDHPSFYHVLSANPATVGLESSISQATGRISCLQEDFANLSGALHFSLYTICYHLTPPRNLSIVSSLLYESYIRKGTPNI